MIFLQVDGRFRTLKYIARVDGYDEEDGDYEGVFLEKVPKRFGCLRIIGRTFKKTTQKLK